jgi:hypothetical protein
VTSLPLKPVHPYGISSASETRNPAAYSQQDPELGRLVPAAEQVLPAAAQTASQLWVSEVPHFHVYPAMEVFMAVAQSAVMAASAADGSFVEMRMCLAESC